MSPAAGLLNLSDGLNCLLISGSNTHCALDRGLYTLSLLTVHFFFSFNIQLLTIEVQFFFFLNLEAAKLSPKG